jgi:hypothetical protein
VLQKVRFGLVIRPKYARNGAHLVGTVDLEVPAARPLYRKMITGSPESSMDYAISTDFDSLIEGHGSRWLFDNEMAARDLARPVANKLRQYIVPFLERNANVNDLFE